MHWLKITSLSIVSFGFCILLILGLLILLAKYATTDKPDAILILGARVLGRLKKPHCQPCFASSVRCCYPLY